MVQATHAAFDTPSGIDLRSPGRSSAAAQAAPDVRLSIHGDLASIEGEWRAFQRSADCTVFQTYEWLSTWQRHVGARAGARPVVVIGRDPRGAMLFLFPLMVEGGAFRRLSWLGSELCDYNAPLLAPGFSAAACAAPFERLWGEIAARLRSHPEFSFDLVNLTKMPEMVGEQANPFMQLAVATNPSGAHLAHLAGDWQTFYQSKRATTTQRRDRTKRKKLAEIGEVRLVTPEHADDVMRTIAMLMEQKARSFARMGVPNIFERPGWAEFYRALATDPASRGIVHVSRLDVGAVWAAVNLGFHHRGRYYYVLTSYEANGEISKHGPGAMHLQELMRYAIAQGCTMFDFTIGDELYKREWADTGLTLHDHVAAATWRGMLAVAPIPAARRAKRWIKQTPAVWNAFTRARALIGELRAKAAG